MAMPPIEYTMFSKANGALTKRIVLGPDGKVVSDGSACVMARGTARRAWCSSMQEYADQLGSFTSSEALATGSLREDLPDQVKVVTKLKLVHGAAGPGVIARDQDHIVYRAGKSALALLDFDAKGMPDAVRQRIGDLGGVWQALVSVIPELANAGRVERASTSAGLSNSVTGEEFPGSGGRHFYIAVTDGSDVARFLKDLHKRCWLAGLGWLMVGAGGQLLERSIVDRVVGSPERLAFEGAPVLIHPLMQDAEARRAIATEGDPLDSLAVCSPLPDLEDDAFSQAIAKESAPLAPEAAAARWKFVDKQSRRLHKKTGLDLAAARRIVERQCDGVLLPNVELPFDDPEFAGCAVKDVLADPDRFEGATLADPLEGIAYGRCKAKVMRRPDGTLWIHSFAHGKTTYQLKYDYPAAVAVLRNASVVADADVADRFVEIVLKLGDLDPVQIDGLIRVVAVRTKAGKNAIRQKLREARQQAAQALLGFFPKPSRFAIEDKCLAFMKKTDTGTVPVKLCNFVAHIIEDQTYDDGATEQRRYLIEGELDDGTPLPTAIVPIREFSSPIWVDRCWGAKAIVHTGAGAAMLGEAIKALSGHVLECRIYGHIGWRKIEGEWFYLHARGAIGAGGAASNIDVELQGELDGYQLQAPGDLCAAVRASIEMLDLSVPVAAAAWRAPLAEFAPVTFSLFEAGATGTLKSALTGVAQAHWGARWGDGFHFPANWSGTANSIEKMSFHAKDALFVIDDFAPAGTRYAVDALHEKTERLMRAQGNSAGRSRLSSDTTQRPTYWPRGLVASSGEDVPRGHSLRARMIIDQIGPKTIDPAKLRKLQDSARAGRLAEAMAGYVQWLAARANAGNLTTDLEQTLAKQGKNFLAEHRRTGAAAASLALGVHEFLTFALQSGAIDLAMAKTWFANAKTALQDITGAQKVEQAQEDPVNLFVDRVVSLLASGAAHLTDKDGTEPEWAPTLLGWRATTETYKEAGALPVIRTKMTPQGHRIGWLTDTEVWLLPDETLDAVQRVNGHTFPIGRNALGKRLRDRGLLVATEKDSFTKKVRAGGGTPRVFVFERSWLLPNPEDEDEELAAEGKNAAE
jgi:hypothetical protein